jgi:glyoxylase I family protein
MTLRLHHVSLLVADTQAAVAFYGGLLGLAPIERPDLGFPGAWFGIGGQQLHLLELPNPDPVGGRPAHGGRDRHTAFLVDDLADLEARLGARGIPFTRSRSGRPAIFCRDPDGNGVELIAAVASQPK